MFEKFYIEPLAFHMAIVVPAFQDLVPAGGIYSNTLSEWTLMDSVATKSPIINIKRLKNIMQRRDKSCDINYKRVMGATVRQITVDEVYGATSVCWNEFYQEALRDFRAKDPVFQDKVMPFFEQAFITDLLSNAYFGDTTRLVTSTAEWSTNIFDGIFKWIKKYYAEGAIPSAQGSSLAQQDLRSNPSAAYAIIAGLYKNMPLLMQNMVSTDLGYYCTKSVADGYHDYLLALGNGDANTYSLYANGVKIMSYKGIPIFFEPVWEPILAEINGGPNYNACILTVRGNFVLGTDKTYGEGPNLDQAFRMWYSDEHMKWYYQQFARLGTQIALPEFVVFAVPA